MFSLLSINVKFQLKTKGIRGLFPRVNKIKSSQNELVTEFTENKQEKWLKLEAVLDMFSVNMRLFDVFCQPWRIKKAPKTLVLSAFGTF